MVAVLPNHMIRFGHLTYFPFSKLKGKIYTAWSRSESYNSNFEMETGHVDTHMIFHIITGFTADQNARIKVYWNRFFPPLMHLSIEIPTPSPPPGPRWGFDLTWLDLISLDFDLTNLHPSGAYWLVKPPPWWGNLCCSLTDYQHLVQILYFFSVQI